MPWCPICKNEYREGIEKCADCGATLVKSLDDIKETVFLCNLGDEQAVEKFLSYLKYSNIEAVTEPTDDIHTFKIFVSPDDLKKAQSEFKAFMTVENQAKSNPGEADCPNGGLCVEASEGEDGEINRSIRIESLEDLEKLKEAGLSADDAEELFKNVTEVAKYQPAGVYQSQSEKANDYFSTGITFLVVGIAALVFTFLNLFGVITLFKGQTLSLIVFFALSGAAIGVGIGAFQRSKKAGANVAAEEKLTSDINNWMERHADIMTKGSLSGEDGTSEEILYLNRTAAMKSELEKVFGHLDDDYIDSLLDDFYNKQFGA